MNSLTVVGLSFRSAPVELREKVAIGEADLGPSLQLLGHGIILSTCNRTEIYQLADSAHRGFPALQLLERRVQGDWLRSHLYQLAGLAAVRHLYAVAAGLDSMVLGEPQILGQVRAALEAAEREGTAGPVLSHLFRQAIRVGRRARAETFVGRHAVSISYAAVELARHVFGKLEGCRALVVGAGEMGELTVRTLADHGVGIVAVANRTLDHAADLAAKFGGRAVPLDRVVPALAASDIVISSTDAPGYVIGPEAVADALAQREDRPLFMIDIAVPRDVDPAVRTLPNVHLYDIDDLKALCNLNRRERMREVTRVEQIIESEAERLERWWRSRQAVPTIVALRDKAEQARREELAEALRKLRHLSAADRRVIDELTRAVVAKILHEPTVRLKNLADESEEETIQLVRSLYAIDE